MTRKKKGFIIEVRDLGGKFTIHSPIVSYAAWVALDPENPFKTLEEARAHKIEYMRNWNGARIIDLSDRSIHPR